MSVVVIDDTPDSAEEMRMTIDKMLEKYRDGKGPGTILMVLGRAPLGSGKTLLLDEIAESIRKATSSTVIFSDGSEEIIPEIRGSFVKVEYDGPRAAVCHASSSPSYDGGNKTQMNKLEKLARKQQNKQRKQHQRRC